MKTTRFLLLTAASIAAAVSCSKEPSQAPVSKDMTITACLGTKAYLEDSTMKWVSSDSLMVFDEDLDGVDFSLKSKNVSVAEFTTSNWTGKTPKYAVLYRTEPGEPRVYKSTSDGVVPVRVRSLQTNLQWKGCSAPNADVAVGTVSDNEGAYEIGGMKNIVGYLKVTLKSANVAAIKVASNGAEHVSGWVDVDFSKLSASDFWSYSSGMAQEDTIVVKPAVSGGNSYSNGCFVAGSYYIAILPQTYASGISISVYGKDGKIITKKVMGSNGGITIERNRKYTVSKAIDTPNFPSEVVLDLYFGNSEGVNPLGFGNLTAANENATTGETYTFAYNFTDTKTGLETSYDFPFTVCKSTASAGIPRYYYTNLTDNVYGNGYVLVFSTVNSWISIPGIEGKYISEITVATGNKADKLIRFKKKPADAASIGIINVTQGTASAPGQRTIHFYTNGNDGTTTSLSANTVEQSAGVYLQAGTANGTRINRVTIKYNDSLTTK